CRALSVREPAAVVLAARSLRRAARRPARAALRRQRLRLDRARGPRRIALAHARPGAQLRVLLELRDARAVDELRTARQYARSDALSVSPRHGPFTPPRARRA